MSDKPIECTLGAVETSLGGDTYRFERDGYGRFVSEVHNLVHRACLLSVVHYREVPEHPAERAPGLADEGESLNELLSDGPTVEEYVAAGYLAAKYPPHGYASRSTPEAIEAAIAAQSGSSSEDESAGEGESTDDAHAGSGEGTEGGEGSAESEGNGTGEAAGDAMADATADTANQQRGKRQR